MLNDGRIQAQEEESTKVQKGDGRGVTKKEQTQQHERRRAQSTTTTTKPSLASRLKKVRGTGDSTPLPPQWSSTNSENSVLRLMGFNH
jgi:hypothetical protein